MRDFELEAARGVPIAPERDLPTPATAESAPVAPGRSPALDAATLMHLQRTAGNAGVVQMLAGEDEQVSPVHDVVGSGGGSALDAGTQSTMESAFGQSFDNVRVHTDDQASQSAESVGANAYTVGSDIVFKSGQFDPGSASGQKTIAHELAHVVQQSRGPVDGSEAAGGIRVSDPSDRFERAADATAEQVMASVSSSQPSASDAGALQREEDPLSAPAAVQREALPEEEEEPGS
ncbi:MAG TPA: DUF4157 domain-containing protein [Candidatus Limnocylindrales bacterium]